MKERLRRVILRAMSLHGVQTFPVEVVGSVKYFNASITSKIHLAYNVPYVLFLAQNVLQPTRKAIAKFYHFVIKFGN